MTIRKFINLVALLEDVGKGTTMSGETVAESAVPEGSTHEAFQTAYDEGVVPNGWYVHGRARAQELSSEYVIQMTKNCDVADQYAGKYGSVWYLRPNALATVFDLTGECTEDMEKVKDAFFRSFEKGVFPDQDQLPEDPNEAWERVCSEFSPLDIVNSAQAYDDIGWVNWLYEYTGATFVIVPKGGAVAFDKEFVDAVKVQQPRNDG